MHRLLQRLGSLTGQASGTAGHDLSAEDFVQAIDSQDAASLSAQKKVAGQSRYRYKTLRKNRIRLIQITGLGPIPTVVIRDFKLEECPAYWAISYHWNKGSQPRVFRANAKTFLASSDVVDILNHVGYCEAQEKAPSSVVDWITSSSSNLGRYPGQKRTILIWIDAVCINQSDDGEKAAQVAIMGKIYRQAAKVVIWLGRSQNDSDLTSDRLWSVSEWLTAIASTHILPHERSAGLRPEPEAPHEILAAVRHLYTRPWFTRVWVVQEVLLAQQAVFLCGLRTIGYDNLGYFTSRLYDAGGPGLLCPSHATAEMTDRIEVGARNLLLLQRFGGEQDQGSKRLDESSLATLLHNCRVRQVSEPVDRVWAFLGLAPPHLEEELRHLIDYTSQGREEYWRAYIKFCKTLILSDTGMSVLSHAPSRERPPGLPSWCPNYNSAADSGLPINPSKHSPFSAGRCNRFIVTQSVRFYVGSDNLNLTGNRVDYVEKVISFDGLQVEYHSNRPTSYGCSSKEMNAWEKKYAGLARDVYGSTGSSDTDVPDAHWRTLTMDQLLRSPLRATNATTVGFVSELESAWFASIGGNAAQPRQAYLDFRKYLDATGTGDIAESPALTPQRRALLAHFLSIVFNTISRTYFSTRDGRIGVGPPATKPGDCVCLFYGAETPFLVRFWEADSDGNMPPARLVGDAYVHGIMYGQGVSRSPEVFCLG